MVVERPRRFPVLALAVIATVVVTFALLVLQWRRRNPTSGVRSLGSSVTVETDRPAPVSAPSTPIRKPDVTARRLAESRRMPSDSERAHAAEPNESRGEIGFDGHVAVQSHDGQVVRDSSGSFEASLFKDGQGVERRTILVDHGCFHSTALRGSKLGISGLTLGGRAAFVNHDDLTIDEGRPIDIEAAWTRDVILRVVDSQTDLDLRDVTVVRGSDSWFNGPTHPGVVPPTDRLVENAASPITLVAPAIGGNPEAETRVFASAPHYAWDSAEVDFEAGQDVTIRLGPEASLEVELVGDVKKISETLAGRTADSHRDVLLGLFRSDDVDRKGSRGPAILQIPPNRRGSTRIEKLKPGPLIVAVEYGSFSDPPLVFAQSRVVLVAGTTTRVTLEVKDADAGRRLVPLAGSVLFGSAWPEDDKILIFDVTPIDAPGATAADRREIDVRSLIPYRTNPLRVPFDLGNVTPGRYLVRSTYPSVMQVIDTGSEGRRDVEVALGDPVCLIVHAIDESTSQPIHAPLLLKVCARRPKGVRDEHGPVMQWDKASETWRADAAAGTIELLVCDETEDLYEIAGPNEFTIAPDRNEWTLRLRRRTGVFVTFDAAFSQVWEPFHKLMKARLERSDGSDASRPHRRLTGKRLSLYVTDPGTYILRFPDIDGCEPIPPINVIIVAGEMTEQTIKLVPPK